MRDKLFGVLQRIGRSFMLPIALLPVAGLLLGVGGSFSNPTMLEAFGLNGLMGPGTLFYAVFTVMSRAGDIVFANLPLLFAMGAAIGMARKEKEVAALSAAISFFIMHASISAMILLYGGDDALPAGAAASVVGISSLQMGVFGGILVGLGVAWLHNRYYRIGLPQILSFFGGSRFVPIVSSLVYVAVGILMFYLWPPVQTAISRVGDLVQNSGYPGTWFYGLMERALIPLGLHHVFYIPFWQTAVGGTMEVGDRLVEGAQNIFFAQLADPSTERFAVSATRFMSGKFPIMIFGLPGAALAMYQAALPERRKEISGLLLSAALTSMVTGITEPLEFTFLFSAPLLYGVHCVLAGLSYLLMHVLKVGVGMTFSGGLIDLFLFGILQGNQKTGWFWIVAVGAGYFLIYYGLFGFLIKKFNYKTPGRDAEQEAKLYTRKDLENRREGEHLPKAEGIGSGDTGQEHTGKRTKERRSAEIVAGLGGINNISDVDCCATRLRCTVHDPERVEEPLLRATGASGVIKSGQGVQIIYGPQVTAIRSELEEYMDSAKEGYETVRIASPMTGTAALLSEAPDEAFSKGMMGEGAVVTPSEDVVRAPADGTISFVFPSRHALGITTREGLSLLIHVGIDTVKLNGSGFKLMVQEGDEVKKGDSVMKLNLEYIRAHAPSLASPVLVTELSEKQTVRVLKTGSIQAGEDLLEVSKKE